MSIKNTFTKRNILLLFIIAPVFGVISLIYAFFSPDVYESTTSLIIKTPHIDNILFPLDFDLQYRNDDSYLAGEIEIMKSRTIREKVVSSTIDSMRLNNRNIPPSNDIMELLVNHTTFNRRENVNILDISVKSTSAYLSPLIANNYAREYINYRSSIIRRELLNTREFISGYMKKTEEELKECDREIGEYRTEKGIVNLNEQARGLINRENDIEAEIEKVKSEYDASANVSILLNNELTAQDSSINFWLKNIKDSSYISRLQKVTTQMKLNRDLVLAGVPVEGRNKLVDQYVGQVDYLNIKLSETLNNNKDGIFNSSPELINDLDGKIKDTKLKQTELFSRFNGLNELGEKIKAKFNNYPVSISPLNRLERMKSNLEKIYSILQKKYNGMLFNTESVPVNMVVLDKAGVVNAPSGPNRILIIFAGLTLGMVAWLGFLNMKTYLFKGIKSSEELESHNINFLCSLSATESSSIIGQYGNGVLEIFKRLRTRLLYTTIGKDSLKVILVTSAMAGEGKSFVSTNLASAFASMGNSLLIDCDLRRGNGDPGLVDYLFDKAKQEEIISSNGKDGYFYIRAGSIPVDYARVLGSNRMREFITDMKGKYEYIVIDSPSVMGFPDTEILSRLVDAVIVVAMLNKTETALIAKTIKILGKGCNGFIGVVLNDIHTYKSDPILSISEVNNVSF